MRTLLLSFTLLPALISVIPANPVNARAGLERLLNKELSGLGPDERQAVDRWLSTLARRFAHLPSEGLKGVAFEYGVGAVEAFLAKGAPELLQVLEDLPEDDPR